MNITIESIKEEQTRLAGMIAAFEARAKVVQLITIPEASIELKEGEHYAGIVLGKDGAPNHHLILLPGEAESISWNDAKDWAAQAGGELPTRREQSLLYANLKDQFQSAWYWSCEQHASESEYAWLQYFINGLQYYLHKSGNLRARTVRRLEIL